MKYSPVFELHSYPDHSQFGKWNSPALNLEESSVSLGDIWMSLEIIQPALQSLVRLYGSVLWHGYLLFA